MQPTSPVRSVALGPRGAFVEPDGRGGYLVRSKTPLGPYPRTLTERLVHFAKTTPERTFIAKRGRDGHWQHLRYRDALARARRIGAALLARGLSAERPLMILSENDCEHALLKLAALHVGVPYVPISPAYSLLSRDFDRLRRAVAALTPGLVFAASAQRYAVAIGAAVPHDTELVTTSGSLAGRHVTPFEELERAGDLDAVEAAHRRIDPDGICQFLMTSGSTGTPKAVIQTQRMLTSNQEMMVACLPCLADPPPVLVDWLPWHHIFGGNHNFGLVLYNGGTLYVDDGKPTPQAFGETLRNLREVAPTIYLNVPRGFDELVTALERDPVLSRQFFSEVRLIFHAAAGLSPVIRERLEALAVQSCGERIMTATGLGMTETAPYALSAHWPTEQTNEVGLPAPGVELRLAPVGEKLEARYRGPSVTPGFWRDEALTRASFDEDGFYRSGDAVAWIDPADPQRGLAFDGRLAEDFKLDSGTWVSVGPLRAAAIAAGAPIVQDVVVTGRDRRELGLLIVPNVVACRRLCASLPTDASLAEVLAQPAIHQRLQQLVDALAARATGSANRITRALLLVEPPSIDAGEVTDKGSIVQQTILRTRAALVERLYAPRAAGDPDIFYPLR